MKRCAWVTDDPLYKAYHDEEWGRPVYEDRYLFEMITLEGAQAGLSWLTILKRRHDYRVAFDQFDPKIIESYDDIKINELLHNEGIVRNKLKINSVVTNAKAFIAIQKEFGCFHTYLWAFVDNEPILNDFGNKAEVPTLTKESERLSKDLKKRGFKFFGPVICYAFMQAVGMVNDHEQECWLYHQQD